MSSSSSSSNERSAGEIAFLQGRYRQAAALLEAAVRDDPLRVDTRSLVLLGMMVRSGFGYAPLDERRAVELFERAARRGCPFGQHQLAKCLHLGQGVDAPQPARAAALFSRALPELLRLAHSTSEARSGSAPSTSSATSSPLSTSPSTRPTPLLAAPPTSDAFAVVPTTSPPLLGTSPTTWSMLGASPPRLPTAAMSTQHSSAASAAQADDADGLALYMLGYSLELGLGCAVDLAAAATAYRRSALKGVVFATYNLATMLADGKGGLERNIERARWLFRRAADAGHALACYNLASLLSSFGVDDELDSAQARHYYRRAVAAGLVAAHYNLAFLLLIPRGGEKDVNGALELLGAAARLGDLDAQYALGRLYEREEYGISVDYNRAVKWYALAMGNNHAPSKSRHKWLFRSTICPRSNSARLASLVDLWCVCFHDRLQGRLAS